MAERVYLDTKDTAAYLHTTVRHIRELVYQRRIPVRRAGGKLIFERGELDAWLDASKVEVAS